MLFYDGLCYGSLMCVAGISVMKRVVVVGDDGGGDKVDNDGDASSSGSYMVAVDGSDVGGSGGVQDCIGDERNKMIMVIVLI